MTLDTALDATAAVLVAIGGLLCLAAGVGLLRFPDALARLHAATKPQVLGLLLVVIAVALSSRSWVVLLGLLPVLLLQAFTAPISAHMVGRAGYRAGTYRDDLLVTDELAEAVHAAREGDDEHQRYPEGRDTEGPPREQQPGRGEGAGAGGA